MDYVELFKPVISVLIVAIAGMLGVIAKMLVTKVNEWLQAKIGSETYDKAYKVAEGIYIDLEDKYSSIVGKHGKEKMDEMIFRLQELYPCLTYDELVSINKQVWLSFQDGYNGTYDKAELQEDKSDRIDG